MSDSYIMNYERWLHNDSRITVSSDPADKSTTSSLSDNNIECLSEEGRLIFSLLVDKLDSIVSELRARDDRMEKVEQENINLKAKLLKLEERLDNVESTNRSSNLILSGGELSSLSGDITTAVVGLLKRRVQYELPPESILATYRLGMKSLTQSSDSRRVMIRFRDKAVRDDVLSALKRMKPDNLYASEDLIPSRSKILFTLRHVKKKSNGLIVAVGSHNGRVFAYLKPPNPSASNQKLFIDNLDMLDQFCVKELGFTSASLCDAKQD